MPAKPAHIDNAHGPSWHMPLAVQVDEGRPGREQGGKAKAGQQAFAAGYRLGGGRGQQGSGEYTYLSR